MENAIRGKTPTYHHNHGTFSRGEGVTPTKIEAVWGKWKEAWNVWGEWQEAWKQYKTLQYYSDYRNLSYEQQDEAIHCGHGHGKVYEAYTKASRAFVKAWRPHQGETKLPQGIPNSVFDGDYLVAINSDFMLALVQVGRAPPLGEKVPKSLTPVWQEWQEAWGQYNTLQYYSDYRNLSYEQQDEAIHCGHGHGKVYEAYTKASKAFVKAWRQCGTQSQFLSRDLGKKVEGDFNTARAQCGAALIKSQAVELPREALTASFPLRESGRGWGVASLKGLISSN